MTSTTFTQHSSPRFAASLTGAALQILRAAAVARRRFVTRRELQALNASQLRDIGLDPTQVSRAPRPWAEPRTMINLMSMR